MSSVSRNQIPPRVTCRQDPSSKLIHYGHVRNGPAYNDRAWVTLCRRGSPIDTVFWGFSCDAPTCLWCVLKELT